jgi:hypothetical protein
VKSRTEKDFGSTRYGYGAARTYIKARARRRADTAILRAANEGLWTAREFRLFCESKLGRWFGDLFLYEASGLHGRQAIHVAREFLDREAWETYKVEAGISPKEASK